MNKLIIKLVLRHAVAELKKNHGQAKLQNTLFLQAAPLH
jgi:hypothetical protein